DPGQPELLPDDASEGQVPARTPSPSWGQMRQYQRVHVSGGFGESGPAGAQLENQIREGLQHGSMRILGPNSIGVACPRTGFNATFVPAIVQPGRIGFLSQSGALLTALSNQNGPVRVSCSAFVSVGSLLDISWAEWLKYLAMDPQTECIGI